ncbi:unnamed protein product [Allacma fusca]|uniref:SANT and BTB domain-containing protein n=1 Tax=Allacma fusca TaxID=39272 RepID=A0A8J2LWB2_9HEXA|nr:unnamed protein product [Allacma fusca]
MEEKQTKEILDFLLSAYRARLAIQDTTDGCPFDFTSFLIAWKRTSWDQLEIAMRENLGPVLEEGLFDSILPYLTPSFESQPSLVKVDPYSSRFSQSSILGSIGDLNITKTKERRKSREKPKEPEDVDIVIHVCDESKGIREDFYCQQALLTREMGYFTRVTVKGQRLRDMDISVHCDIAVFDWLMKWVYHRDNDSSKPPLLEPSNVIGLVVSADFLQMSALVSECLVYTYENIEEVITSSPNLGCLSEQLTGRLSGYFMSADIEKRIISVDKNDRITSRLYIQFILKLNDPEPDMSLGHYASTATLFRCDSCEQYLTNEFAPKLPCSSMRFDYRGRIYACHTKDPNWTLGSFIKELKRELKTWRKVYWRLWGTVHFFYCSSCQLYFPAKNFGACRYHSEEPKQLPVNSWKDDEKTSLGVGPSGEFNYSRRSDDFDRRRGSGMKVIQEDPVDAVVFLPYGTFPCCKEPSYKYTPLPHVNGCQLKEHSVDSFGEEDPNIMTITAFKDLILDASPIKPRLDWGAIIQVTTEKPSLSATTVLEAKETMVARLSRELSTTDSDSHESDSDRSSPPIRKSSGPQASENSGRLWESWLWNNDLTTRYNQDMQREREEKLMMDLACLLSQRVPLDPSVGFHTAKYGFMSRRILKENIGGTYVKIDQSWREQHQLAMAKGHKNKMQKTRPE